MKAAEIIERTNNVYNIFKCIVQLVQYRFIGMDIDAVIDFLIDFVDVDPSYISRQYLTDRIQNYCIDAYNNDYDLGINY